MLTFAIISLTMIVFAIGLAVGYRANARDLQKMIDARQELDALRAALNGAQSQSVRRFNSYERRLSSAQEAINEYEEIFDRMEPQRETQSAIILPFKK
ncbi:hypothetical protein ASD32_04475 [Rhizobium sp. Root483D2]|nr:hypothetical protein ASD32_04475 [Rhizobium sp. Root483D2]